MYGNPQRRASEGVQELRREGGRWLKQCREAAGLSQRELAHLGRRRILYFYISA